MTAVVAAAGPSAYWYLTRSTGAVSLLLLTLSLVLGVIDVRRWSSSRWPRFVLDALHRNVSLLVMVFLALHIITAALDSFAAIPLIDAIVPFIGAYRPVWLGLGAVAFDLLLAITITSMLRQRLGHRTWRNIHWLAYACWPLALVHTLGTGSDVKSGWLLALNAACVLAVLAAVGVRATRGWPAQAALRGGALATTTALLVVLLVWLPGGPLGSGWARRAGTPPALLLSSASSAAGSAGPATSSTAASPPDPFSGGFEASLAGNVSEGPGPTSGLVAVKITTTFGGPPPGALYIEIDGSPIPGGGVEGLTSSRVTLGSSPTSPIYQGRILSLNGGQLTAKVRGRGRELSLKVTLQIEGGRVSGALSASPASSAR
jgi:sulfoxide reductase heme-binding subunit YedZ